MRILYRFHASFESEDIGRCNIIWYDNDSVIESTERAGNAMNYQGILLDFNGTLFFDSHYHNLAWKQISKELRGYELSDDELAHHMHGKNNDKIIEYILGKEIDPVENKKYSLKKEAIYREMCLKNPASFHLAPGVQEFLDFLVKEHIPFTIASASIKENIDFFVENFHLDTWLDSSLIVYDDGSFPDKIQMFQTAAEKIHVDIKECLVMEDSISGIQFAKQAGAKDIIAINCTNNMDIFKPFPYLLKIIDDFQNFPYELIIGERT